MSRRLSRRIEKVRSSRLQRVTRNARNQLQIEDAPPTKSAGFYWIYTDYSQRYLGRQRGALCANAIDIGRLARLHSGLTCLSTIESDGFRLVYNGIARRSMGLRERVHQHFNGGEGTGSLAILRTNLSNLDRWRVTCVTIETREPHESDIPAVFEDVAHDVERIWRLQNGWPLLCTR